jgi:WD40 repeat protein
MFKKFYHTNIIKEILRMNTILIQTKSLLFSLFCLLGFLTAPIYADVKAVKLFDYEGNLKPVTICMVEGKAKVIAPGPYHKTLRIWDFATGECEGVIGGHEGYVRSVTTCVVGGEIKVIAGYDDSHNDTYKTSAFDLSTVNGSDRVNNTIRVWDLQTGKCEQALRRHLSTATAVETFVVDGKTKILSGSGYYNEQNGDKEKYKYGDIHTWDMKTGKCEHILRGHKQSVEAVSTCIVDGKTKLVSASIDKTVRIWDAETGICERVLLGHEDWVMSVASFTIGNQVKIVSGSQDGVVRVWDVHSGECEHILQGPESTNCMLAPAILKEELKLVVGFQSRFTDTKNSELLTIWNLQTGKCEHSIPIAKRFDSVFSFQQNGKTYIVMGFMDGVLIFL